MKRVLGKKKGQLHFRKEKPAEAKNTQREGASNTSIQHLHWWNGLGRKWVLLVIFLQHSCEVTTIAWVIVPFKMIVLGVCFQISARFVISILQHCFTQAPSSFITESQVIGASIFQSLSAYKLQLVNSATPSICQKTFVMESKQNVLKPSFVRLLCSGMHLEPFPIFILAF